MHPHGQNPLLHSGIVRFRHATVAIEIDEPVRNDRECAGPLHTVAKQPVHRHIGKRTVGSLRALLVVHPCRIEGFDVEVVRLALRILCRIARPRHPLVAVGVQRRGAQKDFRPPPQCAVDLVTSAFELSNFPTCSTAVLITSPSKLSTVGVPGKPVTCTRLYPCPSIWDSRPPRLLP